jgi:hypothetical protein
MIVRMLRSGIGGFDPTFYLRQNRDVAEDGVDPLQHYLVHGWKEGRNPSEYFSSADYLAANPDVAQAGVNPLLHFLEYGLIEGRLIGELEAQNKALHRLEERRLHLLRAVQAQYANALARNEILNRRYTHQKEQIRALQAHSAAGIATTNAAQLRSECLSRSLDEALTQIRNFEARSDAEKKALELQEANGLHIERLVQEFERYVKAAAVPDLPIDPERARKLRAFPRLDLLRVFVLIDTMNKALEAPGDVMLLAFDDRGIASLLSDEMKEGRQFFLAQLSTSDKPTEKDRSGSDDIDMVSRGVINPRLNASLDRSFVHFIRGTLNEVLGSTQVPERVAFAFVSLRLYQPTKTVLQYLDEVVPLGGYIAVDDAEALSPGCRRAIAEFLDARVETWSKATDTVEVRGLMILQKIG